MAEVDYNKIKKICSKLDIVDYVINDDGTLDVEGDVFIYEGEFAKLPLRFNKVGGDFYCNHNNLTTLIGSPVFVGGEFDCSENNLTSLLHSPIEVGGDFDCANNRLTSLKHLTPKIGRGINLFSNAIKSLEWCPKTINGSFYCNGNQITTLKHSPSIVNGDFYCSSNPLTSLEYSPIKVGGDFDFSDTKVSSLKYCPEYINGNIYIGCNEINSLDGFNPKLIKGLRFNHTNFLPAHFVKKYNQIINSGNDELESIFLKYYNHYEVWTSGVYSNYNMNLLLSDIMDGLR